MIVAHRGVCGGWHSTTKEGVTILLPAGNCTAVGSYTVPCQGTQCADQQALAVSEVNGTWGNALEIPSTATLNKDNFAGTNAVSCAAPGKCTAGGFYSPSISSRQAFVVTEK